ncbi:MAG: aminopeptidase [Bacillota bacterium]|jgi:aminopeptidase
MARSSFRLWRIERKASAEKNGEFLMEMLDTDPGARYIGEFGIGSNMGITKFTRDILFWDMIADLRKGGEIQLDGVPVQRNGTFLK